MIQNTPKGLRLQIGIRAQPDSNGVVMLGDTVYILPVRLKTVGTK